MVADIDSRQIGMKEGVLRGYSGMGWLEKMSLRRFGEAISETDIF